MTTRIQQRRGNATEWASANPVLSDGEPGFERDTGIIKVGDGVTPWNDLEPLFSERYFQIPEGLNDGQVTVWDATNNTLKPLAAGTFVSVPSGISDGALLAWDATNKVLVEATIDIEPEVTADEFFVEWDGSDWRLDDNTVVSSLQDVEAIYPVNSRLVFRSPGNVMPPSWAPDGSGTHFRASVWRRA